MNPILKAVYRCELKLNEILRLVTEIYKYMKKSDIYPTYVKNKLRCQLCGESVVSENLQDGTEIRSCSCDQ